MELVQIEQAGITEGEAPNLFRRFNTSSVEMIPGADNQIVLFCVADPLTKRRSAGFIVDSAVSREGG